MTQTLLTRVRVAMAIQANRPTRGLFEGQYGSVFKGRSLDFDDLREYRPGDDVKDLDWKATARSPYPLVKRFVALRRHTVLLVVGTGRDLAAMATPTDVKRDLAVLAAGVLGWVAIRHGDVVAAVAGDASGTEYVPAGGTAAHLERVLQAVHRRCRDDGPAADLTATLEFVVRTIRRRTILVLVDDSPELSDEQVQLLRRLTAQHEVLRVRVGDLAATDPRIAGRRAVDVDTGAAVPDYLRRDRRLRAQVAELAAADDTTAALHRLGVAEVALSSSDDTVPAVFRLLERHRHARV